MRNVSFLFFAFDRYRLIRILILRVCARLPIPSLVPDLRAPPSRAVGLVKHRPQV